MKLYAKKLPLGDWIAALLGLHPTRPTESKPAKRKPAPRHRHAAFLELP
jgi:hypothetical protein